MAGKNRKIVGTDGITRVPFDDTWINVDDLVEMLTSNDPNAITRIITDWKIQNPTGTKETFLEESFLPKDVVDNLW